MIVTMKICEKINNHNPVVIDWYVNAKGIATEIPQSLSERRDEELK